MEKNQRLETKKVNLHRALASLKLSVSTPIKEKRDLSGIIKDFGLVYELAWKTLKLYLEASGHEVTSAKHAFSLAYQFKLISDENVWLSILKDRNLTVHTYDETFAKEMVQRIMNKYVSMFEELEKVI